MANLATCNLMDAVRVFETIKRGGDRRQVQQASGDSTALALFDLLAPTTGTPSRHAANDEAARDLEMDLECGS